MMGTFQPHTLYMHPTPIWAVYRDAKTGRLIRKYIPAGDAKQTAQKTEVTRTKRS